VAAAVEAVPTRPSAVVCEWLDPPFAAGHWVPEMVELAGGAEILGVAGMPSHETTWEAVRRREPSVCLLAPCGYDVAETLRALDLERLRADLAGTPALRSGRVYAVDATSYFSRPGPRLVDGVELCAALLHPEAVPDTSPAGAWVRVGEA
jgi:iron complex transport system substrate-binding protein